MCANSTGRVNRVNMTMIAESAGLKKPTLYHYISSRDEILFMLHELFIDALRRNIDARLEAGAEIAVRRDEYVALVTGVIRKAMNEGIVRKADPTLTAHCLFGVCNWAYQWYRLHADPAPEVLAAKC